ncbi:ABC transporter substrate-binding protein [Microbacterium sp. ASV49]|uniref:ABC transporter substrate-binding protein n=1 Tax=Microbacterium candidum TaxID=3041922 RepID=A0ABT7MUB4_9MICO|nr:ABC transporter substrate-binding protein [Microbacterium sp. ASV49]MDL9978040.1 ABC transporter substrate-binding protein [Microbacterium sp. ASV49]
MTRRLRLAAVALAAVAAVALAGCSGGNSSNNSSGSAKGGTLVVDTAFSLETGDPGRNYVPTGNMVLHAVYDTLLTFQGSDSSTPKPDLATMTQNSDATEFTFKLQDGRTFSDGTPVTADDVVFSLDRVAGITDSKANFLMTGITVSKVDDKTVKLTTATPSLQLPAIMTNPSLAILNSKIVKEHGGTTDNSDAAKSWLDANSAGSGPYNLQSLDLTTQVVMVKNPKYNGTDKPAYDKIVVRNISQSSTQLTNLKGGDSNVAVDLSGDQVKTLGDGYVVKSVPSAETLFLLINQDKAVGGVTASPKFAEAVRYALDYPKLLELAGAGSVQATGVIPPMFPGANKEGVKQDLEKAKAALKDSGYNGEDVKLQFPNDNPVGGVEFTPVAERVQEQLKAVGINVTLAPAPFATEVDPYVHAKEAFSLWYWGPDYADSSSFLPFGPGQKVGLRAGWPTTASPSIADLVTKAQNATTVDARNTAFGDYAQAMQQSGPFVPLIVPGSNLASDKKVSGLQYNVTWTLDLRTLQPAS